MRTMPVHLAYISEAKLKKLRFIFCIRESRYQFKQSNLHALLICVQDFKSKMFCSYTCGIIFCLCRRSYVI